MTPKQEAAARQALHRLQAHTDTADLDAIAALNEALAEQQAAEPATEADMAVYKAIADNYHASLPQAVEPVANMTRAAAVKHIKATLAAFGPAAPITLAQDTWANLHDAMSILVAPTQQPLTPREVELIDGMIEVQLHHAAQCDAIANRTMADKQKQWDMERVELLRKLKAAHGITGSKV